MGRMEKRIETTILGYIGVILGKWKREWKPIVASQGKGFQRLEVSLGCGVSRPGLYRLLVHNVEWRA